MSLRSLEDFALLVVDTRGEVLSAEGACARFFGAPRAHLVGRPLEPAAGRDPRIDDALERAISGEASAIELRIGGAPCRVRFEPRRDEGGAIALVLEVHDRATEHTGYLRAVLKQAPGAVWTTDRNLRVTYAFGRVLALGDIDPRAAVGRTIQEFLGVADPTDPAIACHLAALAGTPRSYRYSFRGRLFQSTVEPLRDEAREIVGVIGACADVTDRVATESALTKAKALLEESQRIAHVGSFEWDLESDSVKWSDEMYRIHGVERDQFAGTFEAVLALQHPDDRETVRGTIAELAQSPGAPFTFDHRIVQPSGKVRTVHTRAEAVQDERGHVARFVGSVWDVSELTECCAGLERTISLLEGVIDATADGVLVVDLDGRVKRYNPQFLALWRVPLDVMERRSDEELLTHVLEQLEDPDAFLRGVHELYDAPARESVDVLRFTDGRVYERKSIPQRIRDTIVGRVWSFRDVTSREQALSRAEFLNDSTRLLASLALDQALDAVAHLAVPRLGDACAIDILRDGAGPRRFVAFADPLRAISPEMHPAVIDGHRSRYEVGTIAHLGVPLTCEGVVLGAITFVARASAKYSEEDIETAEELARRCALLVAHARSLREAHDALKARDDLLGVVAHEFRGPLTSIHIAAESLAKRNLPDRAQDRMLAVITREDRRLARFIDELLEVARARAGELALHFESVDLSEAVARVVSRMSAEIAASGSTVSMSSRGPVKGEWDRLRIDEVVANLVSNATRYGLGKPIDIAVEGKNGLAILVVRDHGMGIPPGLGEKIFQPFERAVSARHYGGLGLGLFVARTILSGLGGTIRAETEPRDGCTFVVTLPTTRKP